MMKSIPSPESSSIFHPADFKSKFPDYKWHTLCSSEEVGYINEDFSLQKGKTKYQQMLRFLTSVELLMHSSYFVGSITTGPSLFLLKWFYPNHYPIDCNSKHFSEFSCLPIAERGKISKKYMNLK